MTRVGPALDPIFVLQSCTLAHTHNLESWVAKRAIWQLARLEDAVISYSYQLELL